MSEGVLEATSPKSKPAEGLKPDTASAPATAPDVKLTEPPQGVIYPPLEMADPIIRWYNPFKK